MKNIGVGLAVFISVLAVLGLFSNFLICENIVPYLLWSGVVFSVFILSLIAWAISKPSSNFRENCQRKGNSPLKVIIAIIVILPCMSILAFYKGMPVVFNAIIGSDGTEVVTVLDKAAYHSNIRCFGKTNVADYSYYLNNYICGVDKVDWGAIKKGDKIILQGKQSIFGIHYSGYKI